MTNPVLICGRPEYLNEAMPVLVDEHGNLHVNIAEPTSAFGDLRVAPLTPVAQLDFVYGLNSNLSETTLARTSNIEINLNDFQMALNPGDTLTLAAKVSSTTADISTSITWVEDI